MSDFKFIDKVGLEIEGCWDKQRNDLVPDNSMRYHEFKKPYLIKDDGEYALDKGGNKIPLFGELISPPMGSKEEVLQYLDSNWANETGSLCGYHVHISLKNLSYYCSCMSFGFYSGFIESITNWGLENCMEDNGENHLFWERLEDRNKYCKWVYIPDIQAAIRKKVVADPKRYCMLNYCWNMHKTIECRLFPTFKSVELAKSATMAFVNYVENYLSNLPTAGDDLSIEDNFEDEESENTINLLLPSFNLFGHEKEDSTRKRKLNPLLSKLPKSNKQSLEMIKREDFDILKERICSRRRQKLKKIFCEEKEKMRMIIKEKEKIKEKIHEIQVHEILSMPIMPPVIPAEAVSDYLNYYNIEVNALNARNDYIHYNGNGVDNLPKKP